MSKRLGEIIGREDKTSSWHLNGLIFRDEFIVPGTAQNSPIKRQHDNFQKRPKKFLEIQINPRTHENTSKYKILQTNGLRRN